MSCALVWQCGALTATTPIHNEWQDLKLRESAIFQLSSGGPSCAVVQQDGKVCAWGSNDREELGFPGKQEEPIPVSVPLPTRVKQVACGANHTLGLTFTGVVYSWGAGGNGQLGHGVAETSAPPRVIAALEPYTVTQVAATAKASLALCGEPAAGWVLQWGRLVGPVDPLPLIVKELLPNGRLKVVRITGAGSNFGVVYNSGSVFLWGGNASGQLGTGNLQASKSPTAFRLHFETADKTHEDCVPPHGYRVLQLSVGVDSVAAVSDRGTMWLCGQTGLAATELEENAARYLQDGLLLRPRAVFPPNRRHVIRAFVGNRSGVCVTDDASVFGWFSTAAAATLTAGVVDGDKKNKSALVPGVWHKIKPLCGRGLFQAVVNERYFLVTGSVQYFEALVARRARHHDTAEGSESAGGSAVVQFSSDEDESTIEEEAPSPAVSRALAELSHRRTETPRQSMSASPPGGPSSREIPSVPKLAEMLAYLLCPSLDADTEFGQEMRNILNLSLKQRKAIERRFAPLRERDLGQALQDLLGDHATGRAVPLIPAQQVQQSERLVLSSLLSLAARDALLEALTSRNAELESETARLKAALEEAKKTSSDAVANAQREIEAMRQKFEEKEQKWRNTVNHLKTRRQQ